MVQLTSFFEDLVSNFTFLSFLDILIMTFVIYWIIKLIKGTQGEQVAKGILVIIVVAWVSGWLGLVTVNYVFKNIITVGFLALLIMFQPEIRQGLGKLGRSQVITNLFKDSEVYSIDEIIDEIIDTVKFLSKKKIGALIVITKQVSLSDIINTGVKLDAVFTKELVTNIFTPNTPLHDGAIILDSETFKIKAASCLLPLSKNPNLASGLGTRHRAAIGVSEISDSLSIAVSEETGTISYALNGKLSRFLDEKGLRRILVSTFESSKEDINEK